MSSRSQENTGETSGFIGTVKKLFLGQTEDSSASTHAPRGESRATSFSDYDKQGHFHKKDRAENNVVFTPGAAAFEGSAESFPMGHNLNVGRDEEIGNAHNMRKFQQHSDISGVSSSLLSSSDRTLGSNINTDYFKNPVATDTKLQHQDAFVTDTTGYRATI
eukprot:GILK01017839.1.p1 GENE.GILK01017839.1~~GILK01017839.1.p1  ORF type:complete len:172 (-),score=25.64 GILK01017839.1:70-555(-)